MTTPYFQIALNRDLEQDTARREKAMKVLNVMLSEEAQNRIVADGQDVLSYSQNVPLRLTEYMKDVRDVVEENHMYIRIASNDFFATSKDVVSKMIAGEYTAKQAYRAFNAQLLAEDAPADDAVVLTSGKSYSNVFHKNGGNASFSAGDGGCLGVRAFRLPSCSPQCHVVFRFSKRRAAAGDILRPCALYLLISACESGAFVRKQRCHLLCRCQAGHGNGVVVPERLPVPGDAGQGIAAACLFDLHGDAADHRQRTTVERHEPALAALHKGADGLFQLRTGHGALVSQKTVGHDHGSGHFWGVVRFLHAAGKAVCGGDEHVGAINAPQRVCHHGKGGVAAKKP